MGQAHIVVAPRLLKTLQADYKDQVEFISISEGGDGTFICLVESPLISVPYYGVCDAVIDRGEPLWFKSDADV